MSTVAAPSFVVIYAGKNITHDISAQVISITYSDKIKASADEIELHIEDTDGRWANEWYPQKKDKISVKMGRVDGMMNCGDFEVDEVKLSGPPDAIRIRGLATPISKNVRTKNSSAHEGKTLRQIADGVAKAHGFTINDGTKTVTNTTVDLTKEIHDTKIYRQFVFNAANAGTDSIRLSTFEALLPKYGDTVFSLQSKGFPEIAQKIAFGFQTAIADISYVSLIHLCQRLDEAVAAMQAVVPAVPQVIPGVLAGIQIGRATQNHETDVAFLKRISLQYGIVFSMKGTQMVFMSVYALEAAKPVKTVDKTDLISFELTDKTANTFSSAQVSYHNPNTGKVVKSTYSVQKETNEDGYVVDVIVKDDILVSHKRAENQTQADAMAKAALHNANSHQCSGGLSFPGDIAVVSGINIQLTGVGELSGNFHVTESNHKIERADGYTVSAEVKRVGYIAQKKKKGAIVVKAPPRISVH